MNTSSKKKLHQLSASLATQSLPRQQAPAKTNVCVLELYLGHNLASLKALSTIRALCEDFLEDRYDLHVIDVYEHPEQLEQKRIIAAPTLIKTHPMPEKRFIGSLDGLSIEKLQLNQQKRHA